MSSATSDPLAVGSRVWRSLGARLALLYIGVTLGSFVLLAVTLPLWIHTWEEEEAQKSAETLLQRYGAALEQGGTDALRALFAYDPGPTASVAVRLRDDLNVELYGEASDDESGRVAASLREGKTGGAATRAPVGWHYAAVRVSQGRSLEVVVRDDVAPRVLSRAHEASLLVLLCGLVSAVLGAFVITHRALRPLSDLTRTTQGIIDSSDLSLRVPDHGSSDDLGHLATLFNRMLSRNEALVRAMKESLDNVAHDLRTPLARLRTGAELALRRAPDAPSERDALAEIVEESDRVLAMLTTLMDITEAEAGAMRLDLQDEDLAEIAREAVDLYDFVSKERGVHLVTNLSSGVRLRVDHHRIRQVCANLIDNAVKYTGPGGQVEVAVTAEHGSGVVSVSDTGIGIPESECKRVWDRLFRGDRSRTERGLGLGLSLVKAVVEAHGGTVSLESKVGVGSTFRVRLPRATGAASGTSRPSV